MSGRFWTVCAISIPLAVLSVPALAQDADDPSGASRVALVIGNSAYQNVTPLPNPANDAELIAEKLWESGFEVIESIDSDRETMLADLATFRSRLREGSEALFFYAGHGVQVGGRNYLLPVSVAPASPEDLRAQSVDAQLFVDIMDASGARLNIVLLDACRNNPFTEIDSEDAEDIATRAITVGQSRQEVERGLTLLSEASSGGLAEMTAGDSETMISFATAPGAVAFDGTGRHSPYTASIAENMDEPGVELAELFRRVRGGVRERTDGLQIAWTTSTLENPFYFKPDTDDLRGSTTGLGVEGDTLGGLPPRRIVDRTFWRAIRDTDRLDAFEAYLRTRPDGAFVDEAVARIAALGGDPDAVLATDPALPDLSAQAQVGQTASKADVIERLDRDVHAVPIGVGPRDLDLPATASDGWVYVSRTPRLGEVRGADGSVIDQGSVHYMQPGDVPEFEPFVGSNGGLEALEGLALGQDGATDPVGVEIEVYVDACDMLAGNPYDSERVTAGTRQFILDRNFDAAIVACELAVDRQPEVVRFWAQLARAYRAAGRYEEAREWQVKAVEAGYVNAMVYLGQMHLDGQAVAQDFARAYELFEAAEEAGDIAALTALAWVHRAGVGVPQDYAVARGFYEQGAARRNDWAMTNLAEFYQKGLGVERSPELAERWYLQAANSGELTAQTRLARMYQDGDGIPQDFDKARFWFETAASRGVPNGLTRLGIMYEQGQGTATDVEAAARLYVRAARAGDGEAYFRLGRLYASRTPLFDDPARAALLLERAIEKRVYGAERELAKLHETGRGVPKDMARARDLYAAAAEGNPWAARDAGRAFASDDGVEPDFARAAEWYRRAVEGGVPWAAWDLAKLTEAGRGVDRDRVGALVLYATALGLSDDQNLARLVGEATAGYDDVAFVTAAQRLLAASGDFAGAADGVLGPGTRQALAEAVAARNAGLPPEPVTIETLAALAAPR
ncbi:caspase family protein [Cribrihabitans marinus]|uniref:caspase family protein n=1 Tax=Cribrihabitans marinus TaxID=1227549 RepID=UPI001E516592|nr:caspase family protein [Cribrihabitans marinus]